MVTVHPQGISYNAKAVFFLLLKHLQFDWRAVKSSHVLLSWGHVWHLAAFCLFYVCVHVCVCRSWIPIWVLLMLSHKGRLRGPEIFLKISDWVCVMWKSIIHPHWPNRTCGIPHMCQRVLLPTLDGACQAAQCSTCTVSLKTTLNNCKYNPLGTIFTYENYAQVYVLHLALFIIFIKKKSMLPPS